jgi:hypothetical protein
LLNQLSRHLLHAVSICGKSQGNVLMGFGPDSYWKDDNSIGISQCNCSFSSPYYNVGSQYPQVDNALALAGNLSWICEGCCTYSTCLFNLFCNHDEVMDEVRNVVYASEEDRLIAITIHMVYHFIIDNNMLYNELKHSVVDGPGWGLIK